MLILLWAGTSFAALPSPDSPAAKQEAEKLAQLPPLPPKGNIDHTGRKQKGRASYYAHHFVNRKMADGNRFNPNSDVAASTTLPLGTTAKVTNLSNGRTATVKVADRGPYRAGRVIDLAPKVADQLDMKQAGVVPVTVAPIAVPQPDGAVKTWSWRSRSQSRGSGGSSRNHQVGDNITGELRETLAGRECPPASPPCRTSPGALITLGAEVRGTRSGPVQ
jgi:rare lipoprotein A